VSDFVPGYEASAWNGIGAPKNTPAQIINKLGSSRKKVGERRGHMSK
jgi:tripartite-type tricarboxylate transporter receptor subunit TctC